MTTIRRIACAAVSACVAAGALSAVGQEINRASFNADGSVNQPENWREWVFVGAPLTPNALNDGKAAFPEYHNVYIEPSAFAHWKATGTWADGTQFAKELTLIRESENCDDATGACFESSGQGYFQGEFSGLELKVKDTTRFADEPGNWAYFSFGHQTPPYAPTATAFPTETCNACHEVNAETDFVFTQYYPVLRASKPE
ncbi:MAG: cytochrome P460 family protein [Pseudomonadota bacterium]